MFTDNEFACVQENRYDREPGEAATKNKGTISLLYDSLKNFLRQFDCKYGRESLYFKYNGKEIPIYWIRMTTNITDKDERKIPINTSDSYVSCLLIVVRITCFFEHKIQH